MKNIWYMLALDVKYYVNTYTRLILLDARFIFLTFASMLNNVYQCVGRDSHNSRRELACTKIEHFPHLALIEVKLIMPYTTRRAMLDIKRKNKTSYFP